MLADTPVAVFITTPRGKGKEIARKLIEERLAACINVASVSSIYWWQGKIEEDDEDLLVVKTTAARVEELARFLKQIHPYTVPELIVLPIVTGLEDYINWLREETRKAKQQH